MRVYGEAYLFMNFWMDFLSLLLAARLRRARFHGLRAAAGAALGAAYALLAWTGNGLLRGFPFLLTAMLCVTVLAFGRTGFALFPWVFASSLLLCGLADTLLHQGASAAAVLFLSGFCVLGICFLRGRQAAGKDGGCAVRVMYRGRRAVLPALRDSGNRLSDGIAGLPVIVAPEKRVARLLPEGVRAADLATLPPGWRLLPIRTVAGEGTLMCFRPDAAELVQDGKARKVEATIAISDFAEKSALVPEELFIL